MPKRRAHKVQVIKHSPFRPINWRYQRIAEILSSTGTGRYPIKGIDDAETVAGFAFIRKWENIVRNSTNADIQDNLADVFVDNPALYYAYEISQRDPNDDSRVAIEARILANQEDDVIAQKMCIHDPATINWYEKLFFNVRDRLQSTDYISKQVIGPLLGRWDIGGENDGTNAISAKFFGYFGGETILEFMLYGIDRSLSPPKPGDNIQEYADAFVESMVRGRAMVTSQQFKVDMYKVIPLLELHAKLIEEHNKSKLASGPKSQLEDVVSALVSATPWCVGQNRQTMLEQTPLNIYIGSAVEPRADDLLRIAAGEELPHVLAIKDKKLPEATKKREPDEHIEQRSRSSDS
jgi:hypothetical protein